MFLKFTSLTDEARIILGGMADAASSLVNPTLRLGVTGLSRSGKTVFITALVHNLIHGGRLPLFAPYAAGRIKRAYLQPQPDDDVPRFAYEDHVADLTAGADRSWPESTRLISQLRLTVEFEPEGFLARRLSGGTLNIDIVDYPGEWLLDLPLLDLSYEEWSSAALQSAGTAPRDRLSKAWLKHLAGMDPAAPEDEAQVRKAAGIFTQYLQACRDDEYALSTLPPGRFLMPGDLDGSPLITFAPLEVSATEKAPPGSMWAMMQRRYESYVTRVVKPFFINHFARLDRQIVLVDTLAALNAGPAAVADLKTALETIMPCFRPGGSSILNALLGKRIDKILFAATKADHLHHSSHDRLEAILRLIVDDALARSQSAGAEIDVAALASIRATREARITQDGEDLPSIIGVPSKGQSSDGQEFDGKSEVAMFPGDLPEDPAKALDARQGGDVQFLKLRPPVLQPNGPGQSTSFPNIRLDRA
ncbi:MAG: YcjX family protein, partial [Rhizobiales bacterium]|nr:YcjX family protein [Hyphomicrobiales bacterium]